MSKKITNKCDTSYNWSKARFIPKKEEIIVYSDLKKIKIGDGVSVINDLPFVENNTPLFEGNFFLKEVK